MRISSFTALSLVCGAVSAQSTVVETHKLSKPGAPAIGFGMAVSLHGDLALVVSPYDFPDSGSASVFRREGSAWVHDQVLPTALVEHVGRGAALGADTAVLTEPAHGSDPPSVHVFRHDGTSWLPEQVIEIEGSGPSVALDGDVLAIGTLTDDDLGFDSGTVCVFRRVGSAWVEEAKLVAATPAQTDLFGWKIALDRDVLVASGYSSAATVFRRSGSAWVQEQELEGFVRAVDVDGDVIVLGEFGDSVRVLRWSGSSWVEEQVLARRGNPYKDFGADVAIQGERIVVGTPDTPFGSVYQFHYDGSRWVPVHRWIASDAVNEGFEHPELGTSVALDGAVVLAGAPVTGQNESVFGAAYVFDATDLALSAAPESPAPGDVLELRSAGGLAGAPAVLFLTAFGGTPQSLVLGGGLFDEHGALTVAPTVPLGAAGLEATFQSVGFWQPGVLGSSNEVTVAIGAGAE